jgi:peptidyl-tRNA hydrolase, PTH1 family
VAHVVAGLGNPGSRYLETRHNVGQRVLDHLAPTLRAAWHDDGPALVARGRWRDETVYLVKPQGFMNGIGRPLAAALRRLGADATELIVVYDDIDLPLGTVRVRMKGGHGGHNGVRSIIETLGTPDIRRVKLGIGRPETKAAVPDHVLERFEPDELPVVEEAVTRAAERVLELITRATPR